MALNPRILRTETPWHDLRYEKFEISMASSMVNSHCRGTFDDVPSPSAMIKHIHTRRLTLQRPARRSKKNHDIAVRTDSTTR
jgi:hypothetical protein